MSDKEFKTIRKSVADLTSKQREQLRKDLEREESLKRASDIAQGKNVVTFTPRQWEEYLAQHSISR